MLLTEAMHCIALIITPDERQGGRDGPLNIERKPVLLAKQGDGPAPRFALGTITLSPVAIQALMMSGGSPMPFLRRHATAD